ncbi:MAG: hypothetical protein H0W72_14135, partial [Planctomycetes bacterium]|nr:hypothetical protein [Planctomycetota bacterium]
MGFLGLFTPKWRHRDAKVRLAAVQRLQAHDDGILVKVALGDSDPAVRMAAAARIVSESTLRRLLAASDARVVAMARERLSGVAARLVKEASSLSQCADLLAGISEQSSLAEIVLVGRDRAVRSAALDRLLSLEAPSQSALATIAIQDGDGALWPRALPRIERRADLKDVARKAKRDDVRAGALARLAT